METLNNSYEQERKSGQDFQGYRRHHHYHGNGGIFVGIILVLAGALLIAKNLNILSYETAHVLISWPMLLIALGLFNIARQAYRPGWIFLGIGIFFIIPRIIEVPYDFYQNFWPLVIIFIGLVIILHRKRSFNSPRTRQFTNDSVVGDSINENAVFGGRNITIINDNFTGGKITSIFGGTNVNLLHAKTAPGCTVDLDNVFGGTKFIVPEDWNVILEVSFVFGGFEDRRNPALIAKNDPSKTMLIKGSCVFGGGEITSVP